MQGHSSELARVQFNPMHLHDAAIIALWSLKMDTYEIARELNAHESAVANRLARLRDAGAL